MPLAGTACENSSCPGLLRSYRDSNKQLPSSSLASPLLFAAMGIDHNVDKVASDYISVNKLQDTALCVQAAAKRRSVDSGVEAEARSCSASVQSVRVQPSWLCQPAHTIQVSFRNAGTVHKVIPSSGRAAEALSPQAHTKWCFYSRQQQGLEQHRVLGIYQWNLLLISWSWWRVAPATARIITFQRTCVSQAEVKPLQLVSCK